MFEKFTFRDIGSWLIDIPTKIIDFDLSIIVQLIFATLFFYFVKNQYKKWRTYDLGAKFVSVFFLLIGWAMILAFVGILE